MSLICVAALSLLAGCRSADEGGGPEVVATTTHVADITREVAGDEVEVHGILPPGADPHDYEPRPGDATALAGADLVISSGGEVDEWVDELIESSGTDAEVLTLLDDLRGRRVDENGEVDPHWWQDPYVTTFAASDIRDALIRAEPNGEDTFVRNASRFILDIAQLQEQIGECMEKVPEEDRKLVTAHDSLGYLPLDWGIDIVGSAVPALSTQAQPSAGETADLVELVDSEDVSVVFGEAGLPSELEEAIADEGGATLGEELYADSLGEPGSAGATYEGALRANGVALIEGFTRGDPPSCPEIGLEP